MTVQRKLRVFLCHASQDKPAVRELYRRLVSEEEIDPWLDEENLLPGQDWDLEIEKAVEASDAVIVCISNRSVTKEGYVQKELRKVLDIALEKPEDTIFIIPLRLDECELPRRLRTWQSVDYFPEDQKSRAYQRLKQSLNIRSNQQQSSFGGDQDGPGIFPAAYSSQTVEKQEIARTNIVTRAETALKSSGSSEVDIAGSVLLLIYFSMAALNAFTSSSDLQETLLAISAILAGLTLLRKRQIPSALVFRISLIVYLLVYGSGYRLQDILSIAPYIAGAAAVVAGVVVALSLRLARKAAFYSAVSFAVFLLLVGTYELATNISYNDFTNIVDSLIFITGIITSIFLALDI
jgi:hypothetical protein